MIYIDSIDDPRLKVYRDLTTSKMECREGVFIAEGMWLVRRLLASSFTTHSVLVDQRRVAELGVPIPDDVPFYVTPNGLVEKVIGFNFHRGVIGAGYRRPPTRLEELTGLEARRWTVVACDETQDPENVGTILRTCAAFGATAVLLGPKCPDPFSRRVMRVSMGAALQLPIIPSPNLFRDLEYLHAHYGAERVATVLDRQAEPLIAVRRANRLVLVLGSEGYGLAPSWRTFSDRLVTIPMAPGVDSLNVSVACGIFLHHFTHQAGPSE
jgi:tRNA G18 (ribose-2'-O)-methylase SpoU